MFDIITIQHTFEQVMADVRDGTVEDESFWVGIRDATPESPQKLHEVNLKQGKTIGDIAFKPVGNHTYEVDGKYSLKSGIFVEMLGLTAVNRMGNHVLLGTAKGDLWTYNLVTHQKRCVASMAHYLDLEEIVVFPSSEAVMTVGRDMQVKLWQVNKVEEEGEWRCVRQFRCLNSSNVQLVGRGRNFLQGNSDGAVRMWECGSGSVAYEFVKVRDKDDPVTAIGVVERQGEKEEAKDGGLEFETSNKSVVVAYAKGDIMQFDLASKKLSHLGIKYRVSCMKVVANKYLVLGTEDGQLVVYDMQEDAVKVTEKLNPFPVKLDVKLEHKAIKVFAANGDETLVQLAIDTEKWQVGRLVYLVGLPEMFKVTGLVYKQNRLLVASDSGLMMYDA